MIVKDKVKICETLSSDFTDFQGVGSFALYTPARYAALNEIISRHIKQKYCHFLAQPVESFDKITWYASPFEETPIRFNDLEETEKNNYFAIKESTLNEYKNVINALEAQSKEADAEYLKKAIRYVLDDFIYCYDNKVILAAWGMKPKEDIDRSYGEYTTDLFDKSIKYVSVRINAAEGGLINGLKSIEYKIQKNKCFDFEIPKLEIYDGFTFIGWDKAEIMSGNEPIIEGIIVTALYSKEVKEIIDEGTTYSDGIEEPENYSITYQYFIDGNFNKEVVHEYVKNKKITQDDLPDLNLGKNFQFDGWDNEPIGHNVSSDKTFTARYSRKKPWYLGISDWLWGKGCLKLLLWFFLLLLLIWLLSNLKTCSGDSKDEVNREEQVDRELENREELREYNNRDLWIFDDKDTGKSPGVYRKNPETQLPTNPLVIVPFDKEDIIKSEDGLRKIVSGRLNAIIDKNKSLFDFAIQFKNDFPSDKYEIIYFDTLLNRLQFLFPEPERQSFKKSLESRYTNYDIYVWDETLFETRQISDPAYQNQQQRWHLDVIKAQEAWKFTMGSKAVVVAVVDNGFDIYHEEFLNKITKPYNVLAKSAKVTKSNNNHGTHVAGIAIANTNSKGLLGIAPKCSFMPVQVSYDENPISLSAIIDGVLYSIYQGADVVNISISLSINNESIPLGEQKKIIKNNFKEEERLWHKIFEIADKKKCVLVFGAGNENILAGIDPMHRNKSAIIVSAVNQKNKQVFKSDFSNFGDYTTISAPGVSIFSTLSNNTYGLMDGTSMAAPIVTGAVALLKSWDKELSSQRIIEILRTNALKLDDNIGPLIQLDNIFSSTKQSSPKANDCCPECDQIQVQIDSLNNILKHKKTNCN